MGTGRFELPTCRLGGGRSIQLSYVPGFANAYELTVANLGARYLPAQQALLCDVVAILHAIKVDGSHSGVGRLDCGFEIGAGSGHA